MKLYFLRHADALPDQDDAVRALSQTGKKEAQSLARFLKNAGVAFDAAFTSPLVRARQTAEIVLKICGHISPAKLDLTEALLNETSHKTFDRWLLKLPVCRAVFGICTTSFIGSRPLGARPGTRANCSSLTRE